MSLSSSSSAGKGADSNAVDAYDSGDEWDIGVGNLIIDLDADLEKDQQKMEMSGSKDGSIPVPSAVAALPENIKFVTPVQAPQAKESKSKAKRNKSAKDGGKSVSAASLYTLGESGNGKKEMQGRSGDLTNPSGLGSSNSTSKGSEKGPKTVRNGAGSKKEKEGGSSKSKKDKSESSGVVQPPPGNDANAAQQLGLGSGSKGSSLECAPGTSCPDGATGQVLDLGNVPVDSNTISNLLGIKTESEEVESECRPLKKIKTEKMDSPASTPAPPPLHLLPPVSGGVASPVEQIMVRTRSIAVNTCDVGLATEPECLGPCEPGTSVNLEGIVWQETEDGVLVVNVTWRNKTYVGTLLDCTRHDWAPPRFCESPTSDLEMRGNNRGRGKRTRPTTNAPVIEATTVPDNKVVTKTRACTSSKGRRGSQNSSDRRTPTNTVEDVKASPSSGNKRKNKPAPDLDVTSSSEDSKGGKRMRSNSRGTATLTPVTGMKSEPPVPEHNCPSPVLIDCPHPNCNKKYKHINGLRYHQAHAHTDSDGKLEGDIDSEEKNSDGEDCTQHPSLSQDSSSCNGSSSSHTFCQAKGSMSPARSVTPKGRREGSMEAHSPSPAAKLIAGKGSSKKKVSSEADTESGGMYNIECAEEGPPVASPSDDTGNDGDDSSEKKSVLEKDKAKKSNSLKSEKLPLKTKSARPIVPAMPAQMYSFPTTGFTASGPGPAQSLATTVVQAMSKSPPLKAIQPKPTVMGEPSTVNPALTPLKEKKKKEKKKKDAKEAASPKPLGKGGKPEDGKSPFRDSSADAAPKGEGLLNGSSESHESRLASIKAEADKIYSFTDNAPSPSIGTASRLEGSSLVTPITPLHVVTQNGADSSSVKTNSPAYSDISDAGEDGEGKGEGAKVKTTSPDQMAKESAKKALFSSSSSTSSSSSSSSSRTQPPLSKETHSPYYQGYEAYYSPNYPHSSPGGASSGSGAVSHSVKIKKEVEEEGAEVRVKVENADDKKIDMGTTSHHPSVIQQRPQMYMQPLYYGQYAYMPQYGYSEQGYHSHVMSTNPAYRQQYEKLCEEQHKQRQEQNRGKHNTNDTEKKQEHSIKDRDREEWKQKSSASATLSKAPSLTDLAKPVPNKPKDSTDSMKYAIMAKADDVSKVQSQQAEGLKMKLTEGSHLGRELCETKPSLESSKHSGMDPTLWYRQQITEIEPDPSSFTQYCSSLHLVPRHGSDFNSSSLKGFSRCQLIHSWREESESRLWSYVYPNKYSEQQKAEEERWKEAERDRKFKEESSSRLRSKEIAVKEESKDSMCLESRSTSLEECRSVGKDPRSGLHIPVSSSMVQHPSYMPYVHGYPYGKPYETPHPGFRGVTPMMMQNYPGSYLSPGFSFSPYANKVPGHEDSDRARGSPGGGSKQSSESMALDILQQHASQYKSRSPTTSDKPPHERERGEREIDKERPRSSPSQRQITSHHHLGMGYPLLPGQYDLPYATGLSSPAIVTSQQAAAQASVSTLFPPARRI
ncbi:zinc finger protein 609-like isoform X3 [Hemiscyllium ocellatum]|uniref:zinc finger protein 609-like isoform X3 n=1 Tax=Hemiscyllium ocellatum TaxID=170820 RepID=UPI00296736AE|nr:zinc finger protein 609-like isoform X3 [Hemiscyllium ocellatum]